MLHKCSHQTDECAENVAVERAESTFNKHVESFNNSLGAQQVLNGAWSQVVRSQTGRVGWPSVCLWLQGLFSLCVVIALYGRPSFTKVGSESVV